MMMMMMMMNGVEALLRPAQRILAEAKVDSPRLNAELLLSFALGVPRATLLVSRAAVPERAAQGFESMVRLRALTRVPLQYLTRRADFFSRTFEVRPGVAIPKSSTETLVEQALKVPFRSACDVGCGSGVIALTLAAERPNARVVAVDLREPALRLTRENAKRIGVRVHVVRSNLLGAARGPFDLVVSNPPYIADVEWPEADPEVRHEPVEALSGGPTGLDVIRRLIEQSPRRLADGGRLLLEVGFRQARRVAGLMRERGFRDVGIAKDLDGIERVVGGRKK